MLKQVQDDDCRNPVGKRGLGATSCCGANGFWAPACAGDAWRESFLLLEKLIFLTIVMLNLFQHSSIGSASGGMDPETSSG